MSNRAKILIALLFLIAAVGGWYYLYISGQTSELPLPEPVKRVAPKSATTPSARALEILPLPFLVTEAPKETPAPTASKPEETQKELAKVEAPPNPFLPLRAPKPKTTAQKPPAKAPVPVTKKPVAINETTPNELLRVPTPKVRPPKSTAPVLPPGPKLGETLPLNLEPLTQVAKKTPTPTKPAVAKPQAPTEPAKTRVSKLEAWAKQKGLKLAGVALGPVAVAIFKTGDGFVSLAVGETFPKTGITLKRVGPDYVVLQQGQETLRVEKHKGGE